ncbi:MAG: hypothetical protein AAF845_12870 [Bacteroidota bacterium]
MNALRPLFAAILLGVALPGTVVAPAVHWAGHAHGGGHAHDEGHAPVHHHAHDGPCAHSEAPAEPPEALSEVPLATEADVHLGECPGCAHLQKVHGSEAATLPTHAAATRVERSAPLPEAPAVSPDVATPEGRGPPAA